MAVARGLASRISTVYAMVIDRMMMVTTTAVAVTMMKLFLIVGAGVCTMPIWQGWQDAYSRCRCKEQAYRDRGDEQRGSQS